MSERVHLVKGSKKSRLFEQVAVEKNFDFLPTYHNGYRGTSTQVKHAQFDVHISRCYSAKLLNPVHSPYDNSGVCGEKQRYDFHSTRRTKLRLARHPQTMADSRESN